MKLTSRQQDVFDNLAEVERRRVPFGGFIGYFLHGFVCSDQIRALLKKGVIFKNEGGLQLFSPAPLAMPEE
jgi:hypothetical protein